MDALEKFGHNRSTTTAEVGDTFLVFKLSPFLERARFVDKGLIS